MMDFGASIPEQVDYMVYIWFLIGLSVKNIANAAEDHGLTVSVL